MYILSVMEASKARNLSPRLILVTILVAAALSVIALGLKSAGINWNLVLTLGRVADPRAISQALKECALADFDWRLSIFTSLVFCPLS